MSRAIGVLALLTIAVVEGGFVIVGPLVAILASGLLVLVIPGALAVSLCPGTDDLDPVEIVAFGAAASWCGITVLCVAAFAFHWSLAAAQIALVCAVVLLAVASVVRPLRRVHAGKTALLVAALVSIVMWLGFILGGYTDQVAGPTVASGWSTGEELFQISTVRKIVEADTLWLDRVVYVSGEVPTYLAPVYPFALALISKAGRLDPLLVFDYLRIWTAALSLFGLYALAKGVTRSPIAAMVVTAIGVTLVVAGHAGQAAGMGSWGQLLPLSHIGDFSLGVLLPIALAVVVQFLREETIGLFTVVAPLLLFSMAITHARESIHVLSYVGAAIVVGTACRSFSLRQTMRLAVLAAVTLAFLTFYSSLVMQRASFIREHEAANAAHTRLEVDADLRSGSGLSLHAAEVPPAMRRVVLIGFMLAPIALIAFASNVGMVLLVSGVLGWWIPMHIPLAARLLDRVVYSEMMHSPSRYVFHAAYVLLGLGVFGTGLVMQRWLNGVTWLRRWQAAGIAFGIALGVVLVMGPLADALEPRITPVVLGLGMIGAALIAWWRLSSLSTNGIPAALEGAQPALWAFVVGVVVALLVSHSAQATLFAQAKRRVLPHTTDVAAWYRQAPIELVLPWTTVEMLRREVPKGAVIATDPALGLAVPLASDYYILASGTNFTTDLHYLDIVALIKGESFDPVKDADWDSYRRRLGGELSEDTRQDVLRWEAYYYKQEQLVLMGLDEKKRPIFSEHEADDVSLKIIETAKPSYLLLEPSRHHRLLRLLGSHPARFVKVASDGRFELFLVAREAAGQGGATSTSPIVPASTMSF